MPSREKEWQGIAAEFEERWNFRNCIGTIASKHVLRKQPANSGSYYEFQLKRHLQRSLIVIR